MQINNQRLNQWLSGKIAAYNDGTPESIEMIKTLCSHAKGLNDSPDGDSCLYWCDAYGWGSGGNPKNRLNRHVSWFFEPEEPRYEVKSWVCDDGIWDNLKKEFVGSPIESRVLAEKILKWFLSIEEK